MRSFIPVDIAASGAALRVHARLCRTPTRAFTARRRPLFSRRHNASLVACVRVSFRGFR